MPDAAHALIAATLDRVVAGELQRVMIFAPPQHGKSELVSVRLPAYWLARRPDDPVLLASYAASLAETKSRQSREVVESVEYQQLFPEITLSDVARARNAWEIAGHRGGMIAVGVGGPITGHGGMLGIIDDPVENWQAAQSLAMRNTVWEWWRSTFRTRLWENGAIVLIMTRWHEDDLAGRLLASEEARQWHVLRLPAVAETPEARAAANQRLGLCDLHDPLGRNPGDPLAPGRFSRDALAQIRADAGERIWSAEYQGMPTPHEGAYAQRQWFPIVDAAPIQARRCRFWDFAATSTEHGDWTVGTRMAVADGIYYIEHIARGRWGPGAVERVVHQTAEADGKHVSVVMEQEPGASGKLFVASIVRALAGWTVRAIPSSGSKVIRAMPLMAQAEAGNVRLVRGPWVEAWLDEICAAPNAAHDDQWDSAAGAFAELTRSAGGWARGPVA